MSPDGRTVVFVRRLGDRSELARGRDRRDRAPGPSPARTPGTEWSGPRWRPQGDVLVASRLLPGGWLDLVEVDPATGAVTNLTDDRAKDVEPTWTPDGEHVVFRSDRDGVSNLYALRRADGALLRVSNVLGGAFAPAVAPDGRTIAFASYSARGYDVHVDGRGPRRRSPRPSRSSIPIRPRSPRPEPETGAVAALPPAAHHAAALLEPGGPEPGRRGALRRRHRGHRSRSSATPTASPPTSAPSREKLSALGFYQYDRFRPTFLVTAEDKADLSGGLPYRTRTLNLRGTLPLTRTLRSVQSLSVTWRRERQTYDDLRPVARPARPGRARDRVVAVERPAVRRVDLARRRRPAAPGLASRVAGLRQRREPLEADRRRARLLPALRGARRPGRAARAAA